MAYDLSWIISNSGLAFTPDDFVYICEKAIGEVRAEEACAALDEHSHDCSPRPIER